jgi:hypothetical protein
VLASEFAWVQCAFLSDSDLTDWQWRVRVETPEGAMGEWSEYRSFEFEPCRAYDGDPCGAGVLFDNGYSSGPQRLVVNAQQQKLYDDLVLIEASRITEIYWQQHDHVQATYLSTKVEVFDDLHPAADPVFHATIVADRRRNELGLLTGPAGDWEGYDYEITGLQIELPAGYYWIGLNSNVDVLGTSWDNTEGGPDARSGFGVVVNDGFPAFQAGNLAFALVGEPLLPGGP